MAKIINGNPAQGVEITHQMEAGVANPPSKSIYPPVGKAQVYEQLTTSINNGFIHNCEYCYRGICKD